MTALVVGLAVIVGALVVLGVLVAETRLPDVADLDLLVPMNGAGAESRTP